MATLSVTLLDVGWGDSILIEAERDNQPPRFALVDSNDTPNMRFTLNFLRRYFRTRGIDFTSRRHFLDFVLLTHAHADHGQGLRYSISEFGTVNFWYPKSNNWGALGDLLRYARRTSKVDWVEALDSGKTLPNLGPAALEVLWPPRDVISNSSENDNSVVLRLTLGNVDFILTGDAEEHVWDQIAGQIPPTTRFFKVPHHGSRNGTFDSSGNPAWLNNVPQNADLGISCHVARFGHPHQQVIDLFDVNNRNHVRTDLHYHLKFTTDGTDVQITYSH